MNWKLAVVAGCLASAGMSLRCDAITNLEMLPYNGSLQDLVPELPPVRAKVFASDLVSLSAPPNIWSTYQWFKNGTAIPGATAATYTLSGATASDSGTYTVTGTPTSNLLATPIELTVVTSGSLINTSARVDLKPGASTTLGFVVATEVGVPNRPILIRAVGPSLKAFGIVSPAPQPHLRLFDSAGKDQTPVIFLQPVDWKATFALAGAFSLAGGEQPITAYDVATLAPGAYTVQVTDDSGTGGTVLVEVYMLPSIAFVQNGPL